jgi:NAD+ kinase
VGQRLLIAYNQRLPRARPVAETLAELARRLGARATVIPTAREDQVQQESQQATLILTVGGDGTILRTARLSLGTGVPILGVNLGELGFLAEVQPDEAPVWLPAALEGQGWIEERITLEAVVLPVTAEPRTVVALNEVLVGRARLGRIVKVRVLINEAPLTTLNADGVLVATPTGSTAYCLAAGGPIIDPQLTTPVLVPLLPYLSFSAPLVLPASAAVALEPLPDFAAQVTVDGQIDLPLAPGQRVQVRVGPERTRFLRLRPPGYFYATLVQRLRYPTADQTPEAEITAP